MKIIFLDIDGVLVTEWSMRAVPSDTPIFSPLRYQMSCVEALNKLTQISGAKIVISSTWRFINKRGSYGDGHGTIQALLNEVGVKAEIVGLTPFNVKGAKFSEYITRGREIKEYIDENLTDEDQFVILDDDEDIQPYEANWVQTLWGTGFTKAQIPQALDILGVSQ